MTDDTCYIKADVRLDGGYDRNEGKAGLKPGIISQFEDDIFDAADGCPVDVIIVVEGGESEAVVEEEAPAVVEDVPEPAVEETVEVTGDDLGELLSAGDRSLAILLVHNQETLRPWLLSFKAGFGLRP